MKKAAAALTVIAVLAVSCMALSLGLNVAKANPYEAYQYQAPPIITINSPENNSRLASNEFLINFTIAKPEFGWLVSARTPTKEFKSIMSYLNIILDGKGIRFVEANSFLSEPFNYSERITNLTDGVHSLEIKVHCRGWDLEIHGFWERELPYDVSSGNVSFTSDVTPPRISILKPTDNGVFDAFAIRDLGFPLVFETSESVSSAFYSLDGKEPIATSGNITLSGLSAGLHNVTVYANDTFGNMGESETITFTMEALQEPFPTTLAITASGASIAIVAAGVLVYFKKRKHQ
jgi:hypothetical protein